MFVSTCLWHMQFFVCKCPGLIVCGSYCRTKYMESRVSALAISQGLFTDWHAKTKTLSGSSTLWHCLNDYKFGGRDQTQTNLLYPTSKIACQARTAIHVIRYRRQQSWFCWSKMCTQDFDKRDRDEESIKYQTKSTFGALPESRYSPPQGKYWSVTESSHRLIGCIWIPWR